MATQQIIPAQSPPPEHHLTKKPIPDGVLSPMNLLEIALNNGAAIDVIERLATLRDKERDYQAKVEFDEALNRCQAKLARIAADATNPLTNSKYATYAKLDSVVRPIYTAEGFSLSYGERDCPIPGKTRFVAFLSRAGITKEYLKDITPSTKGPRGNDVMTPIHADAAADSYAKRYLLKDIFNLAIGEDDTDGNVPTNGEISKHLELIASAKTVEELKARWREGYAAAKGNKTAELAVIQAKDARKKELRV